MIYLNFKNKLKSLFARLVRSAIADTSTDNKQIDYLSSIAIKNCNSVFQSIGPVSNHLNEDIYSDIFSVYPDIDIELMTSRDPYNLPATCDREFYQGDRHYDWWLSGLLDYLKIKQIMEKYAHSLKAGDAFYEMGCASGRVLRHFAVQQDDLTVWGSDINSRHIEWMRLNLPEKIRIFQNTILPQIPMESNSINIACAFSVFTHIDYLDFAWLCEIRRVLKDRGFFYVTIHSDDTWKSMSANDCIYRSLMDLAPYNTDYKITEDFLSGPLPLDKTVFSWNANIYNTIVFHKKDYIFREWGRFFKIHEIICSGSEYQDVVVMQKL